ncbi:SGNH/GDSL hydrolase family protein [Pediococcus acidilactici]
MKKVLKEIMFSIVGLLLITTLFLWAMGFFKASPSHHPANPTPVTVKKKVDLKTKKTQPATAQVKILALGDSLTQGVGDTQDKDGYQKRLKKQIVQNQLAGKATVYDEGVSGERSDEILHRLQSTKRIQKEAAKSDVLVVTAGGNDLFQNLQKNVSESESQIQVRVNKVSLEYQNNLRKIFEIARKNNPKIKIVMVGIYNPFYVYFPNVTSISQAVSTFNTTAKATIDEFDDAAFVNIDALSKGQFTTKQQIKKLKKQSTEDNIAVVEKSRVEARKVDSKEKNAYLSDEDHFHPNDKGYDMMTNKIKSALQKLDVFD